MLEKSCQWWLIWYLLFFCHGGAEGQLQWVVKKKVTAYGQNLILLCAVVSCCSEPAGWSVGHKSIILDVKTFSNDPKVKYHGTYSKYGFGVVIRNLSEADLDVTYRCVYGFDQSTPKYLLHDDVFSENVPHKDKEIDRTALYIGVCILVIIGVEFSIGIMAYCVYRLRIKKKRQKEDGTDKEKEALRSDIDIENQQGTDKEKEALRSDIEIENQQGTDKEKEALRSDIKIENQQGTDKEKEALYCSFIQFKNQQGTDKEKEALHRSDIQIENQQDTPTSTEEIEDLKDTRATINYVINEIGPRR